MDDKSDVEEPYSDNQESNNEDDSDSSESKESNREEEESNNSEDEIAAPKPDLDSSKSSNDSDDENDNEVDNENQNDNENENENENESENEVEAEAEAENDQEEEEEEEENENENEGGSENENERGDEHDEDDDLKPNTADNLEEEDEDIVAPPMEQDAANSDSDSSDDGEERKIEQAVDADDVLADLAMGTDDEEEEEKDVLMEDDREEEEQPEEVPITRIEVEIPKIPNELGNDTHFVKLPNFLSVDTHPYDPSWYEDEIDEDEILDEEGRHRLKLKVESTIRWRSVVDENGESHKESNARIVKWSDGSMSLHLGSEIFDIHKQSLMAGDNNHLFIRQGTGLQGQAVFKTKLTFRPHSTDSFTHRKMTLSLAERSHKTQKIRVLPNVGKDPEAHRSEMIKKEEDKLKASIRRENKMRRVREKAPFRGPTASYLEPDAYDDEDDDGGVSLSAIKKRYKKGGAGYNIYTSSDDSEPDIDKKKGSNERKRTAKVVESDDDE